MKKDFIGYYELTKNEHKKLWTNAIIIFDTNVLLDLYRYRKPARDDLLKVMEQFKDRIFAPHHVMLEFHKNRLVVIAEQFNKFDGVSSLVESKIKNLLKELKDEQLDERHTDIELDGFTEQLNKSASKLFEDLNKSKKNSLSPNGKDKILTGIEKLFSKKIGKPYSQKQIDKIYEEGAIRYSSKIPPGYKDEKKPDEYHHNNVLIKKKFGDLLIWKQILDHSLESESMDVIFVTSDVKEDWFWKVKGQTIKCRPELTEEICNTTKVERFKIYTTERFLEYASQFLGSELDEDVLRDVKSVSLRSDSKSRRRGRRGKRGERLISGQDSAHIIGTHIYQKAIMHWLHISGKDPSLNFGGYPLFTVHENGRSTGYEVISFLPDHMNRGSATLDVLNASQTIDMNITLTNNPSAPERISIVYVAPNDSEAFFNFIMESQYLNLPDGVSLIFGVLTEGDKFRPIHTVESTF